MAMKRCYSAGMGLQRHGNQRTGQQPTDPKDVVPSFVEYTSSAA